jgi:hypothetical protein
VSSSPPNWPNISSSSTLFFGDRLFIFNIIYLQWQFVHWGTSVQVIHRYNCSPVHPCKLYIASAVYCSSKTYGCSLPVADVIARRCHVMGMQDLHFDPGVFGIIVL